MNQERLNEVIQEQLDRCAAERGVKNPDYANPEEGDTLSNFTDTAQRLGVTPLQAWGTHWEKHNIAIEKYIKTGSLKSESIEGRITDAINYLLLLKALLLEQQIEQDINEFLDTLQQPSEPTAPMPEKPSFLAKLFSRGE